MTFRINESSITYDNAEYPLDNWISRGGFAEIFAINHPSKGKVVVKKFHDFLSPRALNTAINGYKTRTRHTEIGPETLIYPLRGDLPRGIAYLYVEGQTMDSYIRVSAPIGQKITEIRQMIQKTMEKLEKIIGHGVVHRDIKDSNLLLKPDGDINLLDFDTLTESHEPRDEDWNVGTPYFMSPEHWIGANSPSMDVFSLAITGLNILNDTDTLKRLGMYWCPGQNELETTRIDNSKVIDKKVPIILNMDLYPEDIRTEIYGLLRFCIEALQFDPQRRPITAETTRQLLAMTPPKTTYTGPSTF